jgi:hypothetical protein
MKKYRIKIETEASGTKWYYAQKRVMFVFWVYLTEVKDITYNAYRIGWHSLEEAEKHIQKEIEYDNKIKLKKIVKSEIKRLNK